MTLLTVSLQDVSHVPGIRDGRWRALRPRSAGKEAAGRGHGRGLHRLPGQNSADRVGDFLRLRFRLHEADPELIVDAALVDDLPIAVEDESLRGAKGAELVSHLLQIVAQHGKGNLVLGRMM